MDRGKSCKAEKAVGGDRKHTGNVMYGPVDLQIKTGKIEARVQGRRKTPYKVEIRISPLNQAHCQGISRSV